MFALTLSGTTWAYDLACNFKTDTDWWAINNVYFCDLQQDIESTNSNDVVTSVSGHHLCGKSNNDVVGFRAYGKNLKYFPKHLNDYFRPEKIEFVAVWTTGLKEIHQCDLSPFTNMRILSLWETDLEVIERDLLKFNPKIEYLGLGKNKIKYVDGNVFEHLKMLHTFHIDGNPCISQQVVEDKRLVAQLIDDIKLQCQVDNSIEDDEEAILFDVRIDAAI